MRRQTQIRGTVNESGDSNLIEQFASTSNHCEGRSGCSLSGTTLAEIIRSGDFNWIKQASTAENDCGEESFQFSSCDSSFGIINFGQVLNSEDKNTIDAVRNELSGQ